MSRLLALAGMLRGFTGMSGAAFSQTSLTLEVSSTSERSPTLLCTQAWMQRASSCACKAAIACNSLPHYPELRLLSWEANISERKFLGSNAACQLLHPLRPT